MQALKYIKDYLWGSPVEDEAEVLEATMVRMMEAIQISEGNSDELEPITTDMIQQCVKRIGKVELFSNLCGMVDGIQFPSTCERPINLKSGDLVEYLCYRQDEVHRSQIVKILSKVDDLSDVETLSKTVTGYEVDTKMAVAMVSGREDRWVLLGDSAPKFSLDTVKSSFVPEVGDWLSLLVKYQITEEGEAGEILGVLEIQTLRTKIIEARVTSWDTTSEVGVIDDEIFFNKNACHCYSPKVKDVVTVDALESNQGKHRWRAIRVCPAEKVNLQRHLKVDENIVSHDEHQYRLYVTEDVSFGTLSIGETKDLNVEVHNRSAVTYYLKRSAFHVKRSESQLSILRAPDNDIPIKPDSKLHFTFRCSPTFLGYSEELFVFTFNKFSVKRVFKIYVVDPDTWSKMPNMEPSTKNYSFSQKNKKHLTKHKEQGNMHCIRGIRMKKSPNFMAVRIPPYNIPDSLWTSVYKYYDEEHKPLRLEDAFPALTEDLCIDNYKYKFHTMLYLEEVDCRLRMLTYDIERAFMTRQGEFLCLEVEGLTEKRPSILPGDAAMVQSLRDQRAHLHEGVIHQIGGSKIYLKFAVAFHQAYNGEDVTVHFTSSRSNFMKMHFAIDQALKNLDKEILFPDKILTKPPQVMIMDPLNEDEIIITDLKERKIQWFNHNLNSIQKRAVKNILQGEARPLPYVVFGPPGTGKTLTLVEAVMQIYCLIPDARILVATPSNSSANLFMERLLDTGNFMVGTVMRVLAHYIAMNGNTPERLKPYCGTLDTALETTNTYNLQHRVLRDGMQLNCKKSNIGRHRITVGTCSTIGAMYRLGFEKGHFTHIVVDEAGQATEPEIMTALAFLNKNGGQAVLAGDPMQLGPIVMSTAAGNSGLEESYLERLLNAFPYQRDMEGFKGDLCGYNPCLVTRLIINYRSIPKLLKLPSDMFYDGSLRCQLSEEDEGIRDMIETLHSVFHCSVDKKYPGLVFHGIRGENLQAEESPSWFNRHEASMVVMFLAQLYRKKFKPDDIGIITPYIQQIRFLRWLMGDQELDCPKIGTVEEFQGQERKIILMSCVRSSKDIVSTDRIQSIGFLRSPKRLNVSLTRAQVLLVIFGNPHLLSVDPHWQQVIKYAVEHGGYMGCELPKEFIDP